MLHVDDHCTNIARRRHHVIVSPNVGDNERSFVVLGSLEPREDFGHHQTSTVFGTIVRPRWSAIFFCFAVCQQRGSGVNSGIVPPATVPAPKAIPLVVCRSTPTSNHVACAGSCDTGVAQVTKSVVELHTRLASQATSICSSLVTPLPAACWGQNPSVGSPLTMPGFCGCNKKSV